MTEKLMIRTARVFFMQKLATFVILNIIKLTELNTSLKCMSPTIFTTNTWSHTLTCFWPEAFPKRESSSSSITLWVFQVKL